MKDFPIYNQSDDFAAAETFTPTDQENPVSRLRDVPAYECSDISSVPDSDIGILLPSASLAERKVAVRSKGHFCGHLVIGDHDERVIAVESHLEMNCALVLSARREVVELREQVAFHWIDEVGRNRTHFFDFLVTLRDGSRIAIFVKPMRLSKKRKFVSEVRQIVPQMRSDFADRVVLMTDCDINPVELYNAELLHSVRLADPDIDCIAEAAVANLQGAVTVADLVKAIAIPGQGFRAVVRLVRNHILELVQNERITPDALLRRRTA